MSGNKRLKKSVRARMARTGETYSTARMHILRQIEEEKRQRDINGEDE